MNPAHKGEAFILKDMLNNDHQEASMNPQITFKSHMLDLLKSHVVMSCTENISKASTLDFLTFQDRILRDDNIEAHVTGSAVIISPDSKFVLLINHAKIGLWLPPGGHVESDDKTILDTAMREAVEETGIEDLEFVSKKIFDLDHHLIKKHGDVEAHYHHDFSFLIQAKTWPDSDMLSANKLAWVSIFDESDLKYFALESLLRVRKKLQDRYQGL